MRPRQKIAHQQDSSLRRVRTWYALILLICTIFLVRLFYLQVIKHDYYQKAALKGQLKEYEIPASRGLINAYDGNKIVPFVLNEKRYTLFTDPKFVKDPAAAAALLVGIVGGNPQDYEQKMRDSNRYGILAKKLSKEQKEKIDELKLKGIGTREEEYRTYPQGQLAAQLLGFVNDEGEGKYGIEQFLDHELRGTPGQLRAITDAAGVPLVASKDNVVVEAQQGSHVVLTIDLSMQRQLEDLLKAGLDTAKSASGSALILDANTGAVKAMANYPTYSPGEFFKVEDASLFNNAAVSSPLEVGSIMKPFTVGAALNQQVISKDTSFYDPGFIRIGDATVTNVTELNFAATRSIQDVLQLSLNTGAVYVLKQLGGGEISEKARTIWHDYLVNHYRFGQLTGIEQGYEEKGFVPDPVVGDGLQIQYANTSFGQGISITPLQMGAAFAALVNGGKYYRPYLMDKTIDSQGKEVAKQPEVLNNNVVTPEVSQTIREMLEFTATKNNPSSTREGYTVGSKSGTAQIARPEGGYYEDRYNGTYIGYVGGDKPQYVIVVRVNDPKIAGYAGARAGAPLFASITSMLFNNFSITPKT